LLTYVLQTKRKNFIRGEWIVTERRNEKSWKLRELNTQKSGTDSYYHNQDKCFTITV